MYVPSQGARPVTSKEPAQNAETTATQGPHWPRPVCSSSLYLKTTWNIGFLQGQGQRTKLRPSESGNESQAGFSHLCCTSSFCYLFVTGCLLQYLLLFLAISQELLQQKGAGESCQKPSRPLLTGGAPVAEQEAPCPEALSPSLLRPRQSAVFPPSGRLPCLAEGQGRCLMPSLLKLKLSFEHQGLPFRGG